jgi:hypothetical protein
VDWLLAVISALMLLLRLLLATETNEEGLVRFKITDARFTAESRGVARVRLNAKEKYAWRERGTALVRIRIYQKNGFVNAAFGHGLGLEMGLTPYSLEQHEAASGRTPACAFPRHRTASSQFEAIDRRPAEKKRRVG